MTIPFKEFFLRSDWRLLKREAKARGLDIGKMTGKDALRLCAEVVGEAERTTDRGRVKIV